MAMRLLRNTSPRVEERPRETRVETCAALVFRVLAETGGGAAVLHAGDAPYLEGPDGEIELANEGLTAAAMEALAHHFLSEAALRTLRADGSVRIAWPVLSDFPHSRFTIVAALRRDDLWIEVRHAQAQGMPAGARPPAVRGSAHRDDERLAVPTADELWAR
jgi:hypothetical protein